MTPPDKNNLGISIQQYRNAAIEQINDDGVEGDDRVMCHIYALHQHINNNMTLQQ